ncbi:hypothetical protein BGX28_006140 [Mortierella sp. GBA30]|nr:hypothetical protein BGX28_006140 [Mortierella sp. GBA30]
MYVPPNTMLQGAFTMTAYDAPIHTMHSIENAAWKLPQGILSGFLAILNPVVSGIAPVEIFVRLIGRSGAACIMIIFIGTFFFCGQGIVKASSEIGHELAVSGAFPKAAYMSQLGSKGQPARIGWAWVAMSSSVGLMYLGNTTVLQALTSAVAIELNLVYAIPIALRLFFPHPTRFQPGPFSLGRFQRPIAAIAISWAVLGVFLFSLPGSYPITPANMNYACVLLFTTLSSILGYWYFSAQYWFDIGPKGALVDTFTPAEKCNEEEISFDSTRLDDNSIEEKDLEEIENWLDHLERDLLEFR